MSILSDFAAAAFADARSVIGGESVSIAGGTALSAVLNEAGASRDYELGGFDKEETLSLVVDTVEFSAAYTAASTTYLGKTCTARSQTWRVAEIRKGVALTVIDLVSTAEGA